MKKYGSKQEVWAGAALLTRGKLKKEHLMKSKTGKIVSKKRSEQSKNRWQHLKKYQFTKK